MKREGAQHDEPRTRATPRLDELVRRTRRRARAARALDSLPLALVAAALVALVVALAGRAGWHLARDPVASLVACAATAVLVVMARCLRPISTLELLVRLDRAYGLEGRLPTAYELAAEGEDPAGFAAAAIADAEGHAAHVDPSTAAPFERPPWLGTSFALVALVLVAAFLLCPTDAAPRRQRTPRVLVPIRLDQDATAALRRDAEQRLRGPMDDETRRLVGRYNELLTDVAEGRLGREDALRRLDELARSLAHGRAGASEAWADELAELGRRLGRASGLASDLSTALVDGDAARAAEAARRLAARLRDDPPDRASLEALRRDLARAARAEPRADPSGELERARRETEALLRRERESGLDAQERSLLERQRRELERLEREQRDVEARRRELERLRRDLDEAARGTTGSEDAAGSADAMDRAAEDLNRMAERQLSESQRQELERQIEQLREMIRRQRESGQGSEDESSNDGEGSDPLQRFVLRAGGGDEGGRPVTIRGPGGAAGGQGPSEAGPDQAGAGAGGASDPGGSEGAEDGAAEARGGTGAGGGSAGSGGAGTNESELVLELGGRGGTRASLEVPGLGRSSSSGASGASGGSEGRGRYGEGHSPGSLASPTDLDSSGRVSEVAGEERGGPSRSEVILGAAGRGFVSTGYRPVHADYAGHAEEVLRRDRIPPGYRYYVRRYFQLIRPREAGDE